MKILSSDEYTKHKIDIFKKNPNLESDEYGMPSKWLAIYNSPCGYFGLAESECSNYEEIEKALERSIYGELVKQASIEHRKKVGEIRKANPEKRFISFIDGEFTYKGIPCRWSAGVSDGLGVDISTKYVIDNFDKLDVEVPNIIESNPYSNFSDKNAKIIKADFSTRLRNAMDSVCEDFSYDPYAEYFDYDKLSEDLRDQLFDDLFGPYGDISKVDPYVEDLYEAVNDPYGGDSDIVFDMLSNLKRHSRAGLFDDPESVYSKAYRTLKSELGEFDPYDYDPYEDQFTDEEKKMVTLACYVISNVNYAMRYLDRGTSSSECEPTLDKAYRVLDDPTRSEITNDLFNFNIDPAQYKPMPEMELLRNVMRKIRTNYRRASRFPFR